MMRFKTWYGVAIVAVVVAVGLTVYQSVKYYVVSELEKKNRRIVSFCEEFRWNDDRVMPPTQKTTTLTPDMRARMDAIFPPKDTTSPALSELKSMLKYDANFKCSNYLYLKPKVKKSNTGICHDERSTYYYLTKSYKVFDSMEECYQSGGRRPYN